MCALILNMIRLIRLLELRPVINRKDTNDDTMLHSLKAMSYNVAKRIYFEFDGEYIKAVLETTEVTYY